MSNNNNSAKNANNSAPKANEGNGFKTAALGFDKNDVTLYIATLRKKMKAMEEEYEEKLKSAGKSAFGAMDDNMEVAEIRARLEKDYESRLAKKDAELAEQKVLMAKYVKELNAKTSEIVKLKSLSTGSSGGSPIIMAAEPVTITDETNAIISTAYDCLAVISKKAADLKAVLDKEKKNIDLKLSSADNELPAPAPVIEDDFGGLAFDSNAAEDEDIFEEIADEPEDETDEMDDTVDAPPAPKLPAGEKLSDSIMSEVSLEKSKFVHAPPPEKKPVPVVQEAPKPVKAPEPEKPDLSKLPAPRVNGTKESPLSNISDDLSDLIFDETVKETVVPIRTEEAAVGDIDLNDLLIGGDDSDLSDLFIEEIDNTKQEKGDDLGDDLYDLFIEEPTKPTDNSGADLEKLLAEQKVIDRQADLAASIAPSEREKDETAVVMSDFDLGDVDIGATGDDTDIKPASGDDFFDFSFDSDDSDMGDDDDMSAENMDMPNMFS